MPVAGWESKQQQQKKAFLQRKEKGALNWRPLAAVGSVEGTDSDRQRKRCAQRRRLVQWRGKITLKS